MTIFTMASPDNCYCEAINNKSGNILGTRLNY